MTLARRVSGPLVVASLLALGSYEFARNPNLHHLPWSAAGLSRLAGYSAVVAVVALFQRPLLFVAPPL